MSEEDNKPPVLEDSPQEGIKKAFKRVLEEHYQCSEEMYEANDVSDLEEILGELFERVSLLARARHAARGVVLTLAAYKIVNPSQDIRRHKAEFEGGFSARSIDNGVTVPFLQERSLKYNVESHWLTQTFSFAGPLEHDIILKTTPKAAGPLTLLILDAIEKHGSIDFASAVVTLILYELIDLRNKGTVALIKPKNLSIDQVMILVKNHFNYGYKTNAPRLPQIAIYSLYQCLMDTVDRYSSFSLRSLERMKAANRKSGSVGDIDVELNKQPIEAVEIKFEIPINKQIVAEAIQKIQTASVERYFILSTAGINSEDVDDINRLKDHFLKSNGCEIIVNGVYETIKYYLRLLRSTGDFIYRYTECMEQDEDIDYEHRLAWNEICMAMQG